MKASAFTVTRGSGDLFEGAAAACGRPSEALLIQAGLSLDELFEDAAAEQPGPAVPVKGATEHSLPDLSSRGAPSSCDTLPSLCDALEASARRTAAAIAPQSDSGCLRPGLEQYAARLNCEQAIEEFVKAEFQARGGPSTPLSDTMRKVLNFCWAATGLGRDLSGPGSKLPTSEAVPSTSREARRAAAIENPFAGLSDSERAQLGAEEGLFSGLAETLTFLYKEYVQEPPAEDQKARQLSKRMTTARNFFAKTVVRMRHDGQTRPSWAEGPSEIQWWELLHQIRLAERRHEELEGASSDALPSLPQEEFQEDIEGSEIMQEIEALQLLQQRIVDEMPKDASAGGSKSPSGSDAALRDYFEALVSRPELAPHLNRGSLGPRILTARQWTYARNVLFELLGAAGTMEVWGPSSATLQHEMSKAENSAPKLRGQQARRASCAGEARAPDSFATRRAAANAATLGALPELRMVSTVSDERVSYYSEGLVPRVVLSERMLLLQLAKRGKGRLSQHHLCKKSALTLSLWVSTERHQEALLAPLSRRTTPTTIGVLQSPMTRVAPLSGDNH